MHVCETQYECNKDALGMYSKRIRSALEMNELRSIRNVLANNIRDVLANVLACNCSHCSNDVLVGFSVMPQLHCEPRSWCELAPGASSIGAMRDPCTLPTAFLLAP